MGVWSISAEVEWCCKNAAVALCRRLVQCQTQGRRDCQVRARTMVVCRGQTPAHSAASRGWGLGCCLLRSTRRTCCKWPAQCSSGRPYRNARPRTEPRCSVSPPPRALCTLAASGPKCTWQHLLTVRTRLLDIPVKPKLGHWNLIVPRLHLLFKLYMVLTFVLWLGLYLLVCHR